MLGGRRRSSFAVSLALALCAPGAAIASTDHQPTATHRAAPASVTDPGAPEFVTDRAGPAYVTVMFGRTIWQDGCVRRPGVRTLQQTASDLRALGVSAVGGVVYDRIGATTRPCIRGVTYPTWADLKALRDTSKWTFVSQGRQYLDMTLMTTDKQRYAESGATIDLMAAKGHPLAWGLFNYPNDMQDAAAQTIVSRSFSFGRLYVETPELNPRSIATTYPYSARTFSINGGRCNNPVLPCYTMPVRSDRRTTPPSQIVTVLNPGPDQWGIVQAYRLVEGKSGTMGSANAWDCSSPDWRNRWTGHPENYCRNTFLSAIRQRSKAAKVVSPDVVGVAWGRPRPTSP